MSKKYTVTIVGAGSIGALKPDHIDKKKRNALTLTHAHACWGHPRIDLKYIVDFNPVKASRAAEKWDCQWSRTIQPADIMIAATPTETHLDVIGECIQFGMMGQTKLIIAEKPFGTNYEEAEMMYGVADLAEIPIMVDYSRRFNSYHQIVADTFKRPDIEIYNARVIYARGLKHDGSHAIDLCNWWFGEHDGDKLWCEGRLWDDRDKNDPTYSTVLEYEKCPAFFTGVDGREAYTFEIDVMTSIGRYQFYHYGNWFAYWPIITEGKYGDYKQLGLPDKKQTSMGWNLHYLMENAVNFLDGKEDLKCTGEDALAVHKILEG